MNHVATKTLLVIVIVLLISIGIGVLIKGKHAPLDALPLERRMEFPDGYISPAKRIARTLTEDKPGMHPLAKIAQAATNYTSGVAALRSLPMELTSEQIDRLRDVLAMPHDPSMKISLIEYNSIRNDVADILLRQPRFSPDLLFDFSDMFADSTQDPVWRDYCLQMLASGWQNLTERKEDIDVEDARAVAVSVLKKAAETQSRWAGTALLGLQSMIADEMSAVSKEDFAKLVIGLATNESALEQNRITAVRLAGICELRDACSVVRGIAQTGETETLRSVAIASLGEIGNETDRLVLLSAMGETGNISYAAKRALSVLNRRLQEGGTIN
jgi:hypothetical protein